MVILTFGSQSTSSDHSQWRLPSSPASAARMFTTRSMSGNSNRCGTSASRSLGPMSASSLIVEKIQSMIVRNSFGDENSAATCQELPEEPEPEPEPDVRERFDVEREEARFEDDDLDAVDRDLVAAGFDAVDRDLVAAGFDAVDRDFVDRDFVEVDRDFVAVDRAFVGA